MPKISRSFTDPAYSRLFQGTADYFDYTQDNYDNDYFKGSMNNATEGKFKAVIISGLISGETAGTGGDYTQDIQQVKTGKNIKYKVKVRPIGVTHGTTLPDPCNEELDPKTRMKLVMAHPWALSDFNHDLTRLSCLPDRLLIVTTNKERLVMGITRNYDSANH